MPEASEIRTRFLEGALLAWIPVLFVFIATFVTAFRGLSSQKATGLGAVAGGFAEGLVIFGFAVMVASEIVAVVLLSRSISRTHAVRTFFSVVSIGASVVLLAFTGALLWFVPH
jgi:hypothetical protein